MEEKEPKIKIFVCKHIFLYHGFIYVHYPMRETLYADDIKEVTMKSDLMTVIHGFTQKHVMHKVKKYLIKHNLYNKEGK